MTAPSLKSWVESAQASDTDFPLENLPFGVFNRRGSSEAPRVGVAIGDQIVDIAACANAQLLTGDAANAAKLCADSNLNRMMAAGRAPLRALRTALTQLLSTGAAGNRRGADLVRQSLVPMKDAEMRLPAAIGDYTDFYASIYHATNIGRMVRPDNPLLPNYKWIPIGYHGRASSILVSGTPIERPVGQTRDGEKPPVVGPTQRLDYELEVGLLIGAGNDLGNPIPLDRAEEHIFGLCLVNDWSARDVQAWEYQPLGPFLAKSFATTISPWVVTLDALEPFRARAFPRPAEDPSPLPYLYSTGNIDRGGFDITLDVSLSSAQMRQRSIAPVRVSRGQFTDMYWTAAQLVAHHTMNGCNLRPGDLLASGTVSGEADEARGCLMERTWRGRDPLKLPTGETRAFLEDGDEVTFRAFCERAGHTRIGFGECVGRVVG